MVTRTGENALKNTTWGRGGGGGGVGGGGCVSLRVRATAPPISPYVHTNSTASLLTVVIAHRVNMEIPALENSSIARTCRKEYVRVGEALVGWS